MSKLASYYKEGQIEAGCDEAGRGCLAGPVVAATVILPNDFDHEWLNDSKQLSERKRNLLRPIIEEQALDWAVSFISEQEIDEINILNASILGMHRAVDQLKIKPDFLLIDGNRFKNYPNIPHATIIKGDAKFKSIAAASILAKTYRDEWMEKIDVEFPDFKWKQNKGYPTKAHREVIEKQGATKYHRMSFKLLPDKQFSLFE
jgi:ribonuclease HII